MNRRRFTKRLAGALGAVSLGREIVPGAAGAALVTGPPAKSVNGERLNRHLMELAAFGKNPGGGVSRVAYSDFDRQGREYVTALMRKAGLDVSVDAAGNILGRRAGSVRDLRPIMFGSHIDSVPDGGNYDGDVGSLSAIEVAQTLGEGSVTTRHPLEVVVFQNEEGGTIGSRGMIGELTPKDFDLQTQSGRTIREGIAFIGGSPDRLSAPLRKPGDLAAYVELHIEQGGTLDAAHVDIGIVEGIVGIGRWEVTVEGFANHAGTTAMNNRRDALLSAARFIDAVNRVATSKPGHQVATVGRLAVFPGAPNVIPGRVSLTLEIRDLDGATIRALFDAMQHEGARIGAATGCTFRYEQTHDIAPAICDAGVQRAIEGAATSMGLTTRRLPSGAGHDAQHMARITPAGMIFVPSVGGISHAPTEFTRAPDVVNGANVLLRTILALDAA